MTVTVKAKDQIAVDLAVGASSSQCSTSSRGDGAPEDVVGGGYLCDLAI